MRDSLCLNGEWDFMPLYDQPRCRRLPGNIVYDQHKVQVPSSWRRTYKQGNGRLFGDIPDYEYVPMDLYDYPKEWDAAEAGVLHRSFRLPDRMAGQRIVLRLDGIMQKAVIYLDREEIAVWEDGYLPLRLDITSRVQPDREHHLHVVCGGVDRVTLPSGTQKVTGLTGSWFGTVSRGIWQDVYLESYPELSLEDVNIRTSFREGKLQVRAVVGGPTEMEQGTVQVRLVVRELGVLREDELHPHHAQSTSTPPDPSPVLVASAAALPANSADNRVLTLCENESNGTAYLASFEMDWQDAHWWSPDSPFLYRAELELMVDERVIDSSHVPFGFREFWCEGPQFVLNGIPVNLRGDSWHFQGGVQQTEAYIRNWYRMCRSVGVNSIRLHAEPYPEDYVRIADEEGMLIVDETAIYGSGKSMQADHPAYLENCRNHVRRLVQRDKNHPSVILWSVQNEMRWVDGRDGFKTHIPGLMAAIRELDPTRPILAEGDNRLLSKEDTEVESRHYNIDGTIGQWDRAVPLTFGEHGGWWYICPQNSSMYVGLRAYRGTDESTAGIAEKERLFVEYARRQEVSSISTFNFAHYFMRAMPDRDVILPPTDLGQPGVKPKRIPAYSLTLNNGLLPEDYPSYSPNPAFEIMAEAFKPATIIAAEYNRCFYDDAPIHRSFDVYNDTLAAQDVRVECEVRQEDRLVYAQSFDFRQAPAEHQLIRMQWMPEAVDTEQRAELTAKLTHGGKLVHELHIEYRLVSARLRSLAVEVDREAFFWGPAGEYDTIRRMIPECGRIEWESLPNLSAGSLLIIGTYAEDADSKLEMLLKAFVERGGRLILLEQNQLSLGKLTLSRRPFFRAHAGSYNHPILQGFGDEDLMFWHEELQEEGPLPIIHAAFEKPVIGDFTLLLECGAGDFGDGGDLWSPLIEYRSGAGMFIASQLDLMANVARVPQACLLLRNMLAYAGRADEAGAGVSARTVALVRSGGPAAAFLDKLRLNYTALGEAAPFLAPAGAAAAPGGPEPGIAPAPDADGHGRRAAMPPGQDFGLLVAEACLLEAPGAAEAVRRHAEAGGRVLVLPAEDPQQVALARLLDRPVRVTPHEAYHLAASDNAAMRGISPVDLFGFDKVFLSPRDVVNRVLATHKIEAPGTEVLCRSIEGTAWKDYFVNGYTAEYSRLALVELNRIKAESAGAFVIEAQTGYGTILCSQLLPDPGSDKALRLYSRLFANLGASYDDNLLRSEKGDAQWAVESVMALPCPPHVDYEAMKAYHTDPEFSLNNLGEGLYGWMQKKERRAQDGMLRIAEAGETPWFLSCFVLVPGEEHEKRQGQLRVNTEAWFEIYINGERVAKPNQETILKGGLNRLIAIVRGTRGDLLFGMTFLNSDGTYMKDLAFRLTLDEVEPK
ncbi:glycoside hydrolase family 2 protein [Paenibacillus sp. XY044]|uniref:glycoside hydrolase family 2 protein n=1 Tax=Paenibacillus sp. XY044 TaxID=2026089 RepID=UPI000B98212F|nr:glycoside hydrolase family 2 TIM barrel-domain containing protein [Paenibacillus sp. XY044]OZB98825.1 glycoside hydrolase family 2 [Paenibacillus sp. XY044]